MARPRRRALQPSDIEGLEYFDTLVPLLAQLKDIGTQRDRAGNRQLFYDQYVCLLLLYFFSPTITSLRTLQQASTLEAVQRRLGIRATSLGSFSEAARLFDAKALHQILQELAAKAAPLVNGPDARQLLDLTAVDGSIFRAFPRMAWALWKDSEHRGVKLHLHFDVFCGTPLDASITHASGSETDQLRAMLQPGRLYVIDRGYLDHELDRQIIEAYSSFIGRIKDNGSYTTESQCPLTAADRAAGIASDERLKRLGTPHHKNELRGHQLRLVKVQRTNDEGELETWWLLTNKLDLPAELVALGYRYRWTVERFQIAQEPRPATGTVAAGDRTGHRPPLACRVDGLRGGLAIAGRRHTAGHGTEGDPDPPQRPPNETEPPTHCPSSFGRPLGLAVDACSA